MKRRWWILFSSLLIFFSTFIIYRYTTQRKVIPATVAPAFEDESCRQLYLSFYRKPKIDLKVVFGYKDARPARFVADRYERAIFIQRLTKECKGSNFACGFTRSLSDSDLLTRTIQGPDGKIREIFLRVIHSSVGPDDDENRFNPLQKWRTRYANLAFLQGLTGGDVVIYNGHSRSGGGPDFEPPRLLKDNEVDYSWYREHQPGFNPIIATLEGAPSSLRLLGLYSCASSKHFLERVRKVKPDLGLITSSKLIYFSDALESSLESISSLLSMKCEGSFRGSLKKRNTRASGAEVSGFFEDEAD